MKNNRFLGTTTVLTLCLVLFYLPAILFQLDAEDEVWQWDTSGMVIATCYAGAFLLNYFFLVPALLMHRSRLSVYLLSNLCLIIATMVIVPVWEETHPVLTEITSKRGGYSGILVYLMRYIGSSIRDGVMVALSAALAYALVLGREKTRLQERELRFSAERREIELRSLKAQLNPHFLFNTLNNIYALIGISPDKAQEALHSLSSMLRYMIYDSSVFVDIEKEARFIGEYVELMKLRSGERGKLIYERRESFPEEIRIAPLLFVTLVENAFKHSGSNGIDNYIHIELFTHTENGEEWIRFRVTNTFEEGEEEREEDRGERGESRIQGGSEEDGEKGRKSLGGSSGVGVSNVRQQLNLLYPGDYDFDIRIRNGVYRAEISIRKEALIRAGD